MLFQLFASGVVDSSGKFTTLVVAVAGINDTNGKFATGVVDTGGRCHWRSWHRWKIFHNVAVTGSAP
jgi:hypothetical protein